MVEKVHSPNALSAIPASLSRSLSLAPSICLNNTASLTLTLRLAQLSSPSLCPIDHVDASNLAASKKIHWVRYSHPSACPSLRRLPLPSCFSSGGFLSLSTLGSRTRPTITDISSLPRPNSPPHSLLPDFRQAHPSKRHPCSLFPLTPGQARQMHHHQPVFMRCPSPVPLSEDELDGG